MELESHPNSPTQRPPSWRHYVRIPAILNGGLTGRIHDLKRGTFSQHAIETTCFDLRIRRDHAVTGQFAHQLLEIQDAIDRFIVAHYEPGGVENGGTLRAIIFGTLPPITNVPPKPDPAPPVKHEIFFPPLLAQRIQERWQELGMPCLSDYVISVMRYDLLLGGKHRYFQEGDCSPEMLAALDLETLDEFLANRKPKIKLDYLLEEAAGKELTREECEILLRAIGKKIRALAVEFYL